jgi:orotate phosphoribosyltransferase
MIEGKIMPGQKVIIVEDLISTGGSSLKVSEALREAGFEVLGMVAIFTYGFETARQNFEESHVKLSCLSNYNSLLDEAARQGRISLTEMASLQEWRRDPASWRK